MNSQNYSGTLWYNLNALKMKKGFFDPNTCNSLGIFINLEQCEIRESYLKILVLHGSKLSKNTIEIIEASEKLSETVLAGPTSDISSLISKEGSRFWLNRHEVTDFNLCFLRSFGPGSTEQATRRISVIEHMGLSQGVADDRSFFGLQPGDIVQVELWLFDTSDPTADWDDVKKSTEHIHENIGGVFQISAVGEAYPLIVHFDTKIDNLGETA